MIKKGILFVFKKGASPNLSLEVFMKKSIQALLWGILILAISFLSQVLVTGIYTFAKIFSKGLSAGISGETLEPTDFKVMLTDVSASLYILLPLAGLIAVLLFFVITKARGQRFREEIALHPFPKVHGVGVFFIGITLSAVVGVFLSLTGLADKMKDAQNLVDNLVTGGNLLLTLLSVGILVPIVEEITFRGMLFSTLKRGFSPVVALFIQALFFALFHGNLLQGSYTFFVGLLAGCLVLWYDSLWPAIILHVAFNSINVLAAQLIEKNETLVSTVVFVATLIGLIVSIYGLVKVKPWKSASAASANSKTMPPLS